MSKLRIALFLCTSVLFSGFSSGVLFAQDHDRDDRRVQDRDHDHARHHRKHRKHRKNDHDRDDHRDRDHDRH